MKLKKKIIKDKVFAYVILLLLIAWLTESNSVRYMVALIIGYLLKEIIQNE